MQASSPTGSPAPRIDIPLRDRTVAKLLARHARQRGDRPMLRFEGAQWTYAEADRLTHRIANGLRAAGVGRGEHVAILMENRPEMLWAYVALGKLGAVAVPMNVSAKGELLADMLARSEATTLVAEDGLLARFREVAPQLPALRRLVRVPALRDEDGGTLGAGGAGGSDARGDRDAPDAPGVSDVPGVTDVHRWSDLLAAPDEPIGDDLSFRDPFLILFTSGTTGPSKGSLSTHAYPVTYGLQRAQCFGYVETDVMFTCLPLFHGNALIGSCFSALVVGGTIALSRRFSVRSFWDEVRASGATQFNLLGAMVNFLWSQPPDARDRDHAVRQCTMVPLPDFAAGFEERFGLRLTSVYALSDYGMGTMLGPDHPPDKGRSAGTAAPGVAVAIVDDDDLPLAPREVGEIVLRARDPWTVGQGYWRMPQATVDAWRNLWFHTGDRGYLDEDGYLYFVDRKKDAIRRRGENISSWEVERIVTRHPAVREAAAYPVRAELPEDEVMVSVVLRDGASLTPEALIAHCDANMAYFMVPRFVEFVTELPRTLTEKVEKYKLRARAEQRLGEAWDRERAGVRVTR